MRKIAVLLVLIAAGAGLSAAQNRSLRFVSPVRPPFTDAAPKPRFALDLVEAALQRINVSATTTLVPNGEYGNALLNGSYDGTAVAWRDSARETALLFSNPISKTGSSSPAARAPTSPRRHWPISRATASRLSPAMPTAMKTSLPVRAGSGPMASSTACACCSTARWTTC